MGKIYKKMITNEVLHVGDRNRIQAIAYLSSRLAYFKVTQITHVEVIPGPNMTKEEIIKELSTAEKFAHSVKSVHDHTATVYVILK